ncbi:hypothetical protein [Anoxybacillus gonensis]|nr:hypothetical protein [Anoxybacillus gonensis]
MDLLEDKRQTPKFLLLLGKEPEVNMIAKRAIEEQKLPKGVHFGYMSWQEVFMQLICMQKDETLNKFERLMLEDLVVLLRKKGFERFQCFQHLSYPIVEYSSYFCFYSDEKLFHFNVSRIEKERYYEFH